MHTLQLAFSDRPVWQQQVRRRLAVCMGLAVLLLTTVFMSVKFSPLPVLQDTRIELQLVADIEPPAAEPAEPAEAADLVEPAAVAEPDEPVETVEQLESTELVEVFEPAGPQVTDWYAAMERAVLETVAAAHHVDSMHVAFDEKRRLAAINFRASRAPVKKPIWENVEIDQMGRKILVSGDCYRVLEDWRVTYWDIHRDLGQYITYCNANFEAVIDVAWVEDIRDGYAYLHASLSQE